MSDLFYIQNKGYCGDCLKWWRAGGHGYTVDLKQAWKVSAAEAKRICCDRPEEDFAWPADKVDSIVQLHVNSESLKGVTCQKF